MIPEQLCARGASPPIAKCTAFVQTSHQQHGTAEADDALLPGREAAAATRDPPLLQQQWLLLPEQITRSAEATAWARYCYLVAAMQSAGQNFDRKIVLEATFKGGDLIYGAGAS